MIQTLGIVVFVAVSPTQGLSAPDATLVWDGAINSSAFTEVSIRAEAGTRLAVTTTSGSPTIKTELDAGDDLMVSGSMPIQPDGSDSIVLSIETGGGNSILLDAGELQRGRSPVVLVGETAFSGSQSMPESMSVAASELPTVASAYANIRALVIDGSSLAQLDEQQLRAMLEHVGNCGKTMLIDAAPGVQRLLTQRAGCGGQALITNSKDASADEKLANLLKQRITAMPGTRLLGTLVGSTSANVRLLTIFLAGFLIVFVALCVIPRTRVVALGFCVVATGLAAMLFNSDPRKSFVAWSEVRNGERIARYAAIERLTANTRGTHSLQPQSLERSPRELSGSGLTLHWGDAAGDRRLDWNASLLAEAQLLTAGSFPVEPNLRAGSDGLAVTVCNHGTAMSPPSFLRWRGSTFAVPSLAPSAAWTPVDADPVNEPRPELRLLARRTQRHSLALLQPLRVPANGGKQSAWLMRLETGHPETSPCTG